MKKFMLFATAALFTASVAFMGCNPSNGDDPEPNPNDSTEVVDPVKATVPEPDPIDGKYLVILKFGEEAPVCNDVVFVGSYQGWNTSDSAVAEMVRFQPYLGGDEFNDADFTEEDGWVYVLFEDASEEVQGKPVQLKADGTFSWDFQCGDADAWKVHEGGVNIVPGYAGECDLKAYTAVTVAEMAYWKNHGNPCVAAVKHNYTVTVTSPAPVHIAGDFNGWAHQEIPAVDGKYVITFEDEENHAFKITNGNWDDEILLVTDYNAESGCFNKQGNQALGAEENIAIEVAALATKAEEGYKLPEGVVICE